MAKSIITISERLWYGGGQTLSTEYAVVVSTHGRVSSIGQGVLEGRIFKDSGHLALIGPDPPGNPAANVISFAPPAVQGNKGPYPGSVTAPGSTRKTLNATGRTGDASVSTAGALPKLSAADFVAVTSGWRFDAGFVQIKFNHDEAISEIRF